LSERGAQRVGAWPERVAIPGQRDVGQRAFLRKQLELGGGMSQVPARPVHRRKVQSCVGYLPGPAPPMLEVLVVVDRVAR
jgi:hypothetical protein